MNSKLLLGAAATLALGIGAPAFAQSDSSTVTGGRGPTTVTTDQNTLNLNANKTTNVSKVNNVSTVIDAARTSTTTIDAARTTAISNTSNRSMNLSYADNSQRNGNVHFVADQSLTQSISNRGALNFNGRGSNYSTGSNSVNGAAFAAYSGILNQGWNTGVNSNAAGATNIAAQGTTTFTTR